MGATQQQTGVVTLRGRLIGGALWEAREQQSGEDRFTACVSLDKGEETKLHKAADAVIAEKWPQGEPKKLTKWLDREGDDPDMHTYGHQFINAKRRDAIKMYARRNGTLEEVTREEGVIYPGCFVAISVRVYAMDANPQKKIVATMSIEPRAVMFVKDGEPLGDRVDADSEFADIDSEFDNENAADPFADAA